MNQQTINQRLKILIDKIGVSSRAFSEMIGESPTNTHNYIGARQAEPRAGYLSKVLSHFSNVNPNWLMLGNGEPFLSEDKTSLTQTNISGDSNVVASGRKGKAIQKNHATPDFEKERDTCRTQLEKAQSEIALLRGQLERADALVAAKEEMLTLLRANYNRPT